MAIKDLFTNLKLDEPDQDPEPKPDIAICEICGWRGPVCDCETAQEGSYEEGYYLVHLCPSCDEGVIDDYDMTEEQALKWEEWQERHNPR